MSNWTALLIPVAAGALMAVQGVLNTLLNKNLGLWPATLLVHLLGLAGVGAVLIFTGTGFPTWGKISTVPWYAYLGGFINVAIIATVVLGISRLGAISATTAIIVGQVSTAALLDYLGLAGLTPKQPHWTHLAGLLLLVIGARLLLQK